MHLQSLELCVNESVFSGKSQSTVILKGYIFIRAIYNFSDVFFMPK